MRYADGFFVGSIVLFIVSIIFETGGPGAGVTYAVIGVGLAIIWLSRIILRAQSADPHSWSASKGREQDHQ